MPFPKELADRVESCRYAYFRIKEKALQKLDYILSIQAGYKDGLLESIGALQELVAEFEADYDEVGDFSLVVVRVLWFRRGCACTNYVINVIGLS